MKKDEFILASGSPRRIQIMKEHGFSPLILSPKVDESVPADMEMEQAVMYLSLKKALYAEDLCEKGIILAADTVVFLDRILGKPKDPQDAAEMLWHLKGRAHRVATGVTVLSAHMPVRRVFCEVTKVFFSDYTEKDIEAYLATGEAWDKAGAYAIQGGFAPYIHHIEGDYDNVVGFPWRRICRELKEMNLWPEDL